MLTIEFGINVILVLCILVSAIGVILSRHLLTSTVLLSIFSLLMAAEYLALGAPDVAMTEAAVGAGISTILLLLALFMVGDKEKKTKGNQLIPFLVSVLVALVLGYVTLDMPAFGSADAPAHSHVAAYYLNSAQKETNIPNVVTAVLASYRGFDTLGETTVILTAALAVLLLLGLVKKGEER